MKKTLAWILIVGAFSVATVLNFNHFDKSATVERSIASEINCLESMKNFFNKKTTETVSTLKDLLQSLSRYTLDMRLSLLETLGRLNIKSNDVRRRYAELLNAAYSSGLIKENDLRVLIAKINAQDEWLKIGKNNKVFFDLLEDFADPEKVKNIFDGKFSDELLRLELNQHEFNALKSLPSTGNDEISKALSYIAFVRSLKINERPKALLDIQLALGDESSELSHIKTFHKYQKEISQFIAREKKNGLSNDLAMAQGKIYERLVYGCRAKTVNIDRLAANKRFIWTMISLELSISSASYYYSHSDQPKDAEWFKRFAFDTVIDIGNVLISTKISTDPGSESIFKMIKYYAVGATLSIPPAISYSKMFNVSDKEKEKAYNDLIRSPGFKSKISELITYLEKEEEKIRLQEIMISLEGTPDQNAKELLIKALARELYAKKQGEWIQTGDVGMDRYVFDRIWGVQSAARNIAVNLLMYNALCMGELNPKKAYALALTYFIANKGIFDPTYNYLRRKAINQ